MVKIYCNDTTGIREVKRSYKHPEYVAIIDVLQDVSPYRHVGQYMSESAFQRALTFLPDMNIGQEYTFHCAGWGFYTLTRVD